jgi:hypothetical protein
MDFIKIYLTFFSPAHGFSLNTLHCLHKLTTQLLYKDKVWLVSLMHNILLLPQLTQKTIYPTIMRQDLLLLIHLFSCRATHLHLKLLHLASNLHRNVFFEEYITLHTNPITEFHIFILIIFSSYHLYKTPPRCCSKYQTLLISIHSNQQILTAKVIQKAAVISTMQTRVAQSTI